MINGVSMAPSWKLKPDDAPQLKESGNNFKLDLMTKLYSEDSLVQSEGSSG
jgi:hypothetical protein